MTQPPERAPEPAVPTPSAPPLNEYQQRHLYFGLVQIDKLLTDIEGIVVAAGSRSLFPRYVDDLSPSQRKLLEGSIARLRASITTLLGTQGLRPDRPRIEASGAIRTTLIFAEIAAEELGPSNMRGYGDLDAGQAREVEGVIAELRSRIDALLKELSPEPAAQLEARIARLPASPAAEVLAALEKISRERGLMEFRAGLALAADRMAAPAMEVAVFGRVSCGKSSLLNYLLGAEVLPTGATPITAVPTRIGFGPVAAVTARFERSEKTLPLNQLAALASEQQNPDNRLGVTRLTVTYPSPKLRPGVLFVDTPGLGSIRSWGAMETLAYLPRSDMAILLIDAGSTLGGDELELVRWLHQGGIPVQVLLSKADLVPPADLDAGLRFTAEAICREGLVPTGAGGLAVRPVSVRRAELADAWFEGDILPLYATLQARFRASLDRRLEVLRDGILAALQVTVGGAPPPADREALAQLDQRLRLAEAEGERTRDTFRRIAQQMDDDTAAVVAAVATTLEAAWHETPRLDAATLRTLAGESLGKAMVAHSRGALESLTQLGQTYAAALANAGRLLPGLDADAAEGNFTVRDLPMPEVGPVAWDMSPPRFTALGRKHVTGQFRSQLESHWADIAAALRGYGVVLQQRGLAAEAELQRQFHARADIYRATLQRLSGSLRQEAPVTPELQASLDRVARWRPAADATPVFVGGRP